MNYRIRKNGGKIYLAQDIRFSYYCRDSIKGICDMAMKNGMWNVITMKLCPGSMGVRHFIPLLFVLSILVLPIMSLLYKPFIYLFGVEIVLYAVMDAYFSRISSDSLKQCLLLFGIFPAFHIAYGSGSIRGIIRLFSKEFR